LSKLAGDGLAGTADTVDTWLMVEYRGAWQPRVVDERPLDGEFLQWLGEWTEARKTTGKRVRLQFIKQQNADAVRFFTIDDGVVSKRVAVDHRSLMDAPEEFVADRLYFVCTHGQRDRCCADFGLPVYRALRDVVGDRVWQTTHLGGHRYAPNILVAPDGVMYGRVTVGEMGEFLGSTESGRMAMMYARGRTCYEPVVQAAEILAAEHSPWISSVQTADGSWQVQFRDRAVRVRPREAMGMASCGETRQKAAVTWSLVS
jgi:hypothetical protein